MFYIYKIQNLINNKVYIGQTGKKYPTERLNQHRYDLKRNKHDNPYLQNTWNKYGESSFELSILLDYPTQKEVDEAEIFYIKWFKDLSLSYNILEGGDRPKITTESIEKQKETKRLKRLVDPTYGKASSEVLRKAHLGQVPWNKGIPCSKETLEKLKNRAVSEEQKEKLRQANLGKRVSEETKRKMSEAQRLRHARNKHNTLFGAS